MCDKPDTLFFCSEILNNCYCSQVTTLGKCSALELTTLSILFHYSADRTMEYNTRQSLNSILQLK